MYFFSKYCSVFALRNGDSRRFDKVVVNRIAKINRGRSGVEGSKTSFCAVDFFFNGEVMNQCFISWFFRMSSCCGSRIEYLTRLLCFSLIANGKIDGNCAIVFER